MGDQIDLGLVTLEDTGGMFAGRPGNEVSLRQKELSADTPLDLIVRYENGGGGRSRVRSLSLIFRQEPALMKRPAFT
ncbi:hypothetical protein N6H14_09180 [Paenibacillus sp. CC-CFT747]|nr:hypothetical protein N6H14_09180 [Paenibacillus sp. CC-CFT747]